MASHPASSAAAFRVLVVDDSIVARAVLTRLIDATGRFLVTGTAGTVGAALDYLRREQVDLILLDLALPGVDGLTGLPDLIAAGGNAKVLIVSTSAAAGASASVSALALGAADTLEKPDSSGMSANFGRMLVERLDRLVARPILPPEGSGNVVMPPPAAGEDFDVVAIGASTGGIHALGGLLRALPATFRLPILVTQHLPVSFMPYFAAQLAVLSGRPCEVASDRLRVRSGRIMVAPGDAHLRCVRIGPREAAIRLCHEPAASGCMPSVDPMLASVADVFGSRTLAVVLSGMGRDGAEGARLVHEAGGTVVVQDRETSVVWGMPAAVVAQGFAAATLPPEELGRLVASRRRP